MDLASATLSCLLVWPPWTSIFLRQQRREKRESVFTLRKLLEMTAYHSSVLFKALDALQVMKPQPFGIGMIHILLKMSPVHYRYRL